MLAGLVGFYLVFFTFLYRRARFVSRSIAEPLTQIERMAHRIAVGEYEQAAPAFGVSEFRHTVGELQRMGRLLGESNSARADAESRLTERNVEFTTILSLSPDGIVSFDAGGLGDRDQPGLSRHDRLDARQPDRHRAPASSGPSSASSAAARSRNRVPRPRCACSIRGRSCSSAG